MERKFSYFVSDVHLGLQVLDPEDREKRFLDFLHAIPAKQTYALFLLGDIWDFWYEWHSTVPKGYVRVFASLTALMDAGVKIYFCPGNHDVWAYRYFEELGMVKIDQPAFFTINGKNFCVGHGDALGRTTRSYRFMRWVFHNRIIQFCFSAFIHPTIAMAIGRSWSRNNRLGRRERYVWRGKDEPLVEFCEAVLREREVDYFVFGHFHVEAREILSTGARLIMLDSWVFKDSFFVFEAGREPGNK